MSSNLKEFFRQERNRVFEPGPFFVQRVMAHAPHVDGSRVPAAGLWDGVPGAARPVFALSLVILFVVLAFQIVAPVEPSRAALEPYGDQAISSGEQLLFANPQLSAGAAQFEELMVLEPTQ